jgi:hypothetical protein
MAKRPQHTVRMDDLTWDAFGEAAAAAGTDRSTLLRQFILWYIGRAAHLPRRPK